MQSKKKFFYLKIFFSFPFLDQCSHDAYNYSPLSPFLQPPCILILQTQLFPPLPFTPTSLHPDTTDPTIPPPLPFPPTSLHPNYRPNPLTAIFGSGGSGTAPIAAPPPFCFPFPLLPPPEVAPAGFFLGAELDGESYKKPREDDSTSNNKEYNG